MEFPLELRTRIEQAAASAAPGDLQRAAQAMSEAYRTRTGRGARMVQTEVAVLAYAAARMPATFGAAAQAMAWTRAAMEDAPESLLDVGAGTGAAAWAAREVFPEVREYAMWEREPAMIALGERLMRGEAAFAGAAWMQGDLLHGLAGRRAELVTAAYALGELTPEAREAAVAALYAAAEKALLLVEPGTPEGYRQMCAARQQLLSLGAKVAAPCPHEGACPLEAGDWCHFRVRVARSRLHKRLKGGDAPFEDEKFCYLAVVKPGVAVHPAAARVLRHPAKQAGFVELAVCTAAGTREARRVSKKQGAAFRMARKAEAGDELEG